MEFIFICSFAQQKYGNYSAASKLLKIFHFYIFSLLGKVIEFRSHYFKSPQIDFFVYFGFHTFVNRPTLFKLHFSLKNLLAGALGICSTNMSVFHHSFMFFHLMSFYLVLCIMCYVCLSQCFSLIISVSFFLCFCKCLSFFVCLSLSVWV